MVTDTMDDPGSYADNHDVVAALERRKHFCRFTPEDARLLGGLSPVFERHASGMAEAFYEHLMQYQELRDMLGDPTTVERLKRSQREYLVSLASGDYGADYARARIRIGEIHERIGLEPQWYVGTYGLYMDLLTPHIVKHYLAEPGEVTRALVALNKLMTLDMQLVLDAYYETRQQKALSRSASLAAVGELAASIAHEVRNPLAGMKGALEILRRELAAKPSNREVVEELMAQIERLEHLVRDLLDYARPEPPSKQPFDLHELLDRVVRSYRDRADATEVTVRRSYNVGCSQVLADPSQMEQVFLNLVHNAVQAMDRGGELAVSTAAERGRLVVELSDTGHGISDDVLRSIFQPFFTTRHRGSGLGLSIVKKIVEAHGGEVGLRSEQDRGTTATVTLPMTGGA